MVQTLHCKVQLKNNSSVLLPLQLWRIFQLGLMVGGTGYVL